MDDEHGRFVVIEINWNKTNVLVLGINRPNNNKTIFLKSNLSKTDRIIWRTEWNTLPTKR